MSNNNNKNAIGAEDIVSNLYDDEDSNGDIMESQEDVVDDLNYDVYNLVTRNYHNIQVNDVNNIEQVLLEHVTRATQLLVKK